MIYNVFGGTLNLTQPTNYLVKLEMLIAHVLPLSC